MPNLTSVQEAAFAAFQEAAVDLLNATGMRRIVAEVRTNDSAENPHTFSVFTNKANHVDDYCFGYGPSIVDAARDASTKFEASKAEPAKLRNAKEAIEAVKAIIGRVDDTVGTIGVADLEREIAALPLA